MSGNPCPCGAVSGPCLPYTHLDDVRYPAFLKKTCGCRPGLYVMYDGFVVHSPGWKCPVCGQVVA